MQDLIFVRTLKGHSDKVKSVVFSPDGQTLASGSDDKTIKIWHLANQESRTLKGHGESSWSGGINSVGFSPDGKKLAGKAEGRGQKAEGIYPFPGMPEPSGRPEGAKGLSPPPKSLIRWLAISVGLKPTLYCKPSAFCLLPSAFFT